MAALRISRMLLTALCLAGCGGVPVFAQTVTVVGTRHLTGLEIPPDQAQFDHAVDALLSFRPTQVCVERMSGARIQTLIADPARHGMTLNPETHGRPLTSAIIPAGARMQAELEIRPADARDEARRIAASGQALAAEDRIRLIALQLAGYEFHSAVLNWSYLDETEQARARQTIPAEDAEAMSGFLASVHEVYSLGMPLARRAGLNALCTADSLEDESAGMRLALGHGGEDILDSPHVRSRFDALTQSWQEAWRPEDGPGALTAMLRRFNGPEFAEMDRRLQWETLLEFDTPDGAFRRRLMLWHARTSEISAEIYRALSEGPDERVMLIIGSAHRPFTEADLRSQPWLEVRPALEYLGED
jgi:hypothetical protein